VIGLLFDLVGLRPSENQTLKNKVHFQKIKIMKLWCHQWFNFGLVLRFFKKGLGYI
jgi:hypothetical protein